MNKCGQMGDGIFMIYRLLLITAIAFIIFGISSVVYAYEINIRNAEAAILAREVSFCLSPNGVLVLDEIPKENYGKILSYCGFSNVDRFYVEVNVTELSSENKIVKLYEGDFGSKWIKKLFGNDITKYSSGYFNFSYPVFVLKDSVKIYGNVDMEVLVNYEDK